MKKIASVLALLFPILCMAGESAQTLVDTDLMQEPYSDAKSLAKLKAHTAVEVLKRMGGWLQVKPSENPEGWLKLTVVKLGGAGAGADTKGDTGLTALWNTATQGRSGNTGVTVATGVRGLSPEDMKNAKPNPEAVKKLGDFAVNKSQAEAAAKKAKLSKHDIDYFADAAGSKK